jgi:hypothetical protein
MFAICAAVPSRAALCGVLLALAGGCGVPETPAWDGTYGYRWLEETVDGQLQASFLNDADARAELLWLERSGDSVAMSGNGGRRRLALRDAWSASGAGWLEGCTEPVEVRPALHRQGGDLIWEMAWTAEGLEHRRRRGYRLLDGPTAPSPR